MQPDPQAWSSLIRGPLLWLTVTLLIYLTAQWLHTATRSTWLNPVLVSIVAMGFILTLTHTTYVDYAEATRFIHFMLGPATVALAVPLYHRVSRLSTLLGPITVALVFGALGGVLGGAGAHGGAGGRLRLDGGGGHRARRRGASRHHRQERAGAAGGADRRGSRGRPAPWVHGLGERSRRDREGRSGSPWLMLLTVATHLP